jgi:hypothetical protein
MVWKASGTLKGNEEMKMLLSCTIAAFVALAGTTSVQAGEMTLTSTDGSVTIEGPFLGFDQMAYVIMYQGQELHVPVALMACEGDDCLNLNLIEFVDVSLVQG